MSVRKGQKTILVVGDGFAEGFGDWVVFGRRAGAARFFEKLAAGDEYLRCSWRVESAGHFGSCSEEWIPSCSRKPTCSAWGVRETLWKDLVGSGAFARASVIVLMLGSMDRLWATEPASYKSTAENIKLICKELSRVYGKKIVVCTMAGSGSEDSLCQDDVNRNVLIKTFVEEEEKGAISIGADLFYIHDRNNSVRCFDGIHFNAAGYKRCALKCWEAVQPLCVQSEWAGWKKRL